MQREIARFLHRPLAGDDGGTAAGGVVGEQHRTSAGATLLDLVRFEEHARAFGRERRDGENAALVELWAYALQGFGGRTMEKIQADQDAEGPPEVVRHLDGVPPLRRRHQKPLLHRRRMQLRDELHDGAAMEDMRDVPAKLWPTLRVQIYVDRVLAYRRVDEA